MLLVALCTLFTAPLAAQTDYETRLDEQAAPARLLLQSWSGEFSEIMERRVVRALVVYSHTSFFFDGAAAKGAVAELLREFQKDLNRRLKVGNRPFHVVPIPVHRDQLIPFLEQGRAEIAAASIVPTEALRERVAFANATYANFSEVVVTGPGAPKIKSLQDLSGKKIHVQQSRGYWQTLTNLNESFEIQGLAPMELALLSEQLEEEDILQMVDAGVIPITITNDFTAKAWSRVLDNMVVHKELAVGVGREIAWAIRPDAQGLKPYVDSFIKKHRVGTVLGNILVNRYFKSDKYLEQAVETKGQENRHELEPLFRKYADRYGFDYLMLAAQGYQESRLNQNMKSHAGAIGIMQLLPSTAADKSVGIPDISTLENNIHAGVKYLRYIIDTYFDDPEIDTANRFFFALASYNAGPNRIHRLRKKAAEMGYDPNLWFGNVELVVARKVSREPVQYVRNIYKYFVAYSLSAQQGGARRRAKDSPCLNEADGCQPAAG